MGEKLAVYKREVANCEVRAQVWREGEEIMTFFHRRCPERCGRRKRDWRMSTTGNTS